MERRRKAEALVELARQLEAQADALWLVASDLDRWGLGKDGDEARSRSRRMRVQALIGRANAVGLDARFASTDEWPL